ncbi:hypothetical protein LY13_003618 [Prauserella aidingensis]|nr:hypothetical protein [Prauserella aidingensis]
MRASVRADVPATGPRTCGVLPPERGEWPEVGHQSPRPRCDEYTGAPRTRQPDVPQRRLSPPPGSPHHPAHPTTRLTPPPGSPRSPAHPAARITPQPTRRDAGPHRLTMARVITRRRIPAVSHGVASLARRFRPTHRRDRFHVKRGRARAISPAPARVLMSAFPTPDAIGPTAARRRTHSRPTGRSEQPAPHLPAGRGCPSEATTRTDVVDTAGVGRVAVSRLDVPIATTPGPHAPDAARGRWPIRASDVAHSLRDPPSGPCVPEPVDRRFHPSASGPAIAPAAPGPESHPCVNATRDRKPATREHRRRADTIRPLDRPERHGVARPIEHRPRSVPLPEQQAVPVAPGPASAVMSPSPTARSAGDVLPRHAPPHSASPDATPAVPRETTAEHTERRQGSGRR